MQKSSLNNDNGCPNCRGHYNIPQDAWYEVVLDVGYNGGISYTASATIFTVDLNGDRVSSIANASATFDNATLAGDDSVYNYFGVHDLSGSLDNFFTTAVPEPSTVMLGSLCLIGLLRRRR